jgi:FMN-dependent NADH-azoreductase
VVIGAPLYNYSLPSTLTAWVDYVHVTGTTNPLDTAIPKPLANRPVVICTARGGFYHDRAPNAGRDHGTVVLQLILGTVLGMRVEVIAVDGTRADGAGHTELTDGLRDAAQSARRLAAGVGPIDATQRSRR